MKKTAAVTLAERLVELRIETNQTQEDTAARLGITRGSLSHFEKRRRHPDLGLLVTIADHFNVSVDYLLGRTNERSVLDVREPANTDS